MRCSVLLALLTLMTAVGGRGQAVAPERVPVAIRVAGLPDLEIEVLVLDSAAFLPAAELFDYLGVWAEFDSGGLSVSGFFKHPDTTYAIDVGARTARRGESSYSLTSSDALIDRGAIYLRTDLFLTLFGLSFRYDARALTVTMKGNLTLPAVRYRALERGLQAMRARGSLSLPLPETYLERDMYATGAGRLTWNVNTRFAETRTISNYNFYLGAKVIGGDLDLTLNGTADSRFHRAPLLRGTYRIPFPHNKTLTQIIIGRRVSGGIYSFDALGIEFTNRPLATRFVFDRELYMDRSIPLSIVEVGGTGSVYGTRYTTTDPEGDYEFEVPVRYGGGQLDFRTYDRYGYFDVNRQFTYIPYTMVPPGQTEYSVFAGKLATEAGSYLSTNRVNVGISSRLTVGAIADYYDINGLGRKWHAALTTTSRLTSTLALFGTVAPTARSQVGIDWRPMSSSQIQLNHFWYSRNDPLNLAGVLDRSNASIGVPLTRKADLRLNASVERTHYTKYRDDQIGASIVGLFGSVTPRIGTRYNRQKLDSRELTLLHLTDFSIGAILPLNVAARAELVYSHLSHELYTIRLDALKSFSKRIYIHIAYDAFLPVPTTTINLSLRYIFPFLDVNAGVTHSDVSTIYNVRLSGSLQFDMARNSYAFSYLPVRTKLGGFTLRPYIDANNNNVRDAGETLITTGRVIIQNNTLGLSAIPLPVNSFTTNRLPAYQDFSISLDAQTLEDPMLVPRYGTIGIITESNYIKDVDLPIVYSGVVRGSVTDEAGLPLEGINIVLTPVGPSGADAAKSAKRASTFSTGEFEFISLRPGEYTVEVEPSQLVTSGWRVAPERRTVTLVPKPSGDVVDGVSFKVSR